MQEAEKAGGIEHVPMIRLYVDVLNVCKKRLLSCA